MAAKEMIVTVCVASVVAFLTARVTAKLTIGEIDKYAERLTGLVKDFLEDILSLWACNRSGSGTSRKENER